MIPRKSSGGVSPARASRVTAFTLWAYESRSSRTIAGPVSYSPCRTSTVARFVLARTNFIYRAPLSLRVVYLFMTLRMNRVSVVRSSPSPSVLSVGASWTSLLSIIWASLVRDSALSTLTPHGQI